MPIDASMLPGGYGTVAAVSTCGYFGFLIGPPAVRGLAQLVGLAAALWLLVGLSAAGSVATTVASRRAT